MTDANCTFPDCPCTIPDYAYSRHNRRRFCQYGDNIQEDLAPLDVWHEPNATD